MGFKATQIQSLWMKLSDLRVNWWRIIKFGNLVKIWISLFNEIRWINKFVDFN